MATSTRYRYALAVTVQGVPQVFVERAVPAALFLDERSAERPQVVAIARPDDVTLGRAALDLDQRCEVGANVDVLLTDDAAGALRALFAVRRRATTYLAAAIDEATTMGGFTLGTITVGATGLAGGGGGGGAFSSAFSSAFDVGGGGGGPTGHAWIGGECFHYTGATSTTLTGVTRAMYGTRAGDHAAGAQGAGASVWIDTGPPSWRGRKVSVYVVDLEAGTATGIASGRLDGPPQPLGERGYRLTGSSLADWYRERQLGVGLRAVTPTATGGDVYAGAGLDPPRFIVATDDAPLFATAGNFPSLLVAELDTGHIGLHWHGGRTGTQVDVATDAAPPYLERNGADAAREAGALDPVATGAYGLRWRALRHAVVVEGYPGVVAAIVLLSREGTQAAAHGTTYDLLPGYSSSATDAPDWRFGAALYGDEVDVEAFLDVGADGPAMAYPIGFGGPITLGEFLREWCEACGAYWYVDDQDQITVRRLAERALPSETLAGYAVTDATLAADSPEDATVDEASIVACYVVEADHDPIADRHRARVSVRDVSIERRYPHSAQTQTITLRGVGLDVRALLPPRTPGEQRWTYRGTTPIDVLRARLRRRQTAAARPSVTLPGLRVGWAARAVRPGAIVAVTMPRTPDLEGGTVDAAHLVVGRAHDTARGEVLLDLRRLDPGYLVAPTGTVASTATVGGSAYEITFTTRTGGAVQAEDDQPGENFVEGWAVWCVDATGANAPELKTITTNPSFPVTTTTITLTSAPTFTPTHVVPAAPPRNPTATTANGDGYTRADYLIQSGTDGLYAVSGTDYDGPRWA